MTDPKVRTTIMEDMEALQIVLEETGLFPPDLLPEMLAASEGEDGGFWLSGLVEGTAMGLCHAKPEQLTEGTWNMLALAVRPDVQGQGLGQALVAGAEACLRERGQRLLIVETSGTAGYAQARRFYAQAGYAEEARIRDFWAAGDDKVILRKAL